MYALPCGSGVGHLDPADLVGAQLDDLGPPSVKGALRTAEGTEMLHLNRSRLPNDLIF